MRKEKTIHTARTMMFLELSKIMDHSGKDNGYMDALQENVANKKTSSNRNNTNARLKNLYSFEVEHIPFKLFKYFWQIAPEHEKPVICFLYALGNDFLLRESSPIVMNTKLGDKVSIDHLDENIEALHPNSYSENTRRSAAQNIASSWKQAGFITGKVKNIRTQPEISHIAVAFAFVLAYCDGQRGDFIISSKWAKSLGLGDQQLRSLAFEAARRDLLQYQFAGSVTSISFNNLFKNLGIDGI